MNAYIFDVDGVITDPQKRIITRPELIACIIRLLENENTIAFISGRALSWLKERIVNKLEEYIRNNNLSFSLLDNIFISGEFGGSNIIFESGVFKEIINSGLKLNPGLVEQATKAAEQFSDIVFIDKYKQTQFTVEMQDAVNIIDFAKQENEIASVFRKIVKDLGLEETVEVHEDRIAVNIKYKSSNKMFATKQFIDWLNFKKFYPEKIKAFGDAVSDLEIGHELRKNNLNFDFIYVGNPEDIRTKTSFPVIFTKEKFGKETDEGTLEFLKSG
jgi:hydroxymethylpyrimidine pyrophosphatase-like HAD family hydrolase